MKNNFNTQYARLDTQYNILIEFCLIFLIIFTPLAYGAIEPWGIAVFEVTSALMILFWIFKMLKYGVLEFIHTPINSFILLFILYICSQLFFSSYKLYTTHYTLPSSIYLWATKTESLKIISYALIFLVTLNTIKTRRQIFRILSIIITVGFIMSVFYLMRYFGAKAPRGIINSNHFAGYLGMVIPLALGFLFTHPLTADRYTLTANRFLLFFTIITMSAALFFTMSRGGMFSFIGALLFMAMLVLTRKTFKKKGWILAVVVIFLVLIISWLGATPLMERILSIKVEITSRYFNGRLPIWQGTVNIIKDFPLFGTGLGTFNYIFPKYQPAEIIMKHYTYAHSDFLELLSESGIVGFSIFLLGLIVFIIYAFRHFRLRHDPYVIGMSIGIFGSLTSIFIHSFADFNLHIPANVILLTLILAVALIVLNLKKDRFGERVGFRRLYFRFSRISTASEDIPQKILLEIFKVSLYPLVLIVSVFYIFTVLRPFLADYYFRHATSQKSQSLSYKPQTQTKLLERAIKLDSTNARYHYYLGKSYSNFEAWDLKLAAYKKAVELNPTNSKYRQSLAWTYGQLADLSRLSVISYQLSVSDCIKFAHREFREAIRLEPNNPYRHRAYAIWLLSHPTEENIEEGIAEYKKAIELEPSLDDEAKEYIENTKRNIWKKKLSLNYLKGILRKI